MTNRFCNPDDQYCDETGLPYAGGFLYFYASGTDTPLNTYSDEDLAIANDNPIELDSAGRPGSVFLQTLPYKVVLADADDVVIWTMDPVSTSDYTTIAQFITYAGDPNGNVAGTAGSGDIPSSVVWDSTHDVLYVCTTSGTAVTAVWTAVNPSNAANAPILMPQGYLTLTSGTPVITGDVTAATSVFYTPFRGNLCPVYNGSSFVLFTFSEQTLTLSSSQSANSIYDVWAFSDSGVFTIGTGPAWSTITAGSGARGSGAGTTQLQLINGINVNAVSLTARNGATTYSVSANQATYLGSIFMDGSAGQITCHRTYGQSRKWGVWNAYNRVPIYLKAGDSTGSWTVAGGGSVRASNGSSSNVATIFSGLAEEIYNLQFVQKQTVVNTNTATNESKIGIGLNSTTAFTGRVGDNLITASGLANNVLTLGWSLSAQYFMPPSLGINNIQCCEQLTSGTAATAFGSETNMVLSAVWMG